MAIGVKHIWTQDEKQFLKDNFNDYTNPQLAKMLGLTLTVTRNKLYELGLKKMKLQYWTEEQIKFLIDNYKKIGDTELSEIFSSKWEKEKGWSKKHIEKKRRYLHLKRTPEQIKQIREDWTLKGLYAESNRKMWETRGITKVGDIRIWKNNYGNNSIAVIKTEEGFVHYNRWLYESTFRILKSNDLVVTKSGNPIAQGVEDLEVIDRKEHARRNSLLRYPEELRNTVQLIRELNKSITQKTNNYAE